MCVNNLTSKTPPRFDFGLDKESPEQICSQRIICGERNIEPPARFKGMRQTDLDGLRSIRAAPRSALRLPYHEPKAFDINGILGRITYRCPDGASIGMIRVRFDIDFEACPTIPKKPACIHASKYAPDKSGDTPNDVE